MINFDRDQVEAPNIEKDHKTPEVYEALGIVFYKKCYLCETQELEAENFDIEHFNPHIGNDDLLKLWINLYLACHLCNQYKSLLTNILDPCNPAENVEKLIIHELAPFEYTPKFYPSNPRNEKIVNTCKLLDKIHNGSDEKSIKKTAKLRRAIQLRANELIAAILNFHRNTEENEAIERYKAYEKIKQICSRRSPYTMLMRDVATRYMKQEDLQNLFD